LGQREEEADPVATAKLKPLSGDQTEIDVIVRRSGRTYHTRKRISSVFDQCDLVTLGKEVEYMIAMAGREIRRDILWHEAETRTTNPFSWSPGPTRVQFYQ
jgi:hypothetical protein